MQNDNNEQLDEIEDKLRKEVEREKIAKEKTSGKSVFELQKIITEQHKNKKTKKLRNISKIIINGC